MLIDLQRATAELTASVALVHAVRDDPELLDREYELTDREKRQLLAMVSHPGMQGSCILYRINRVVPLIMNLRRTLEALGTGLEPVLSAYWQDHPWGYRYGYVECERFCHWLRCHSALQREVAERLAPVLEAEEGELQTNLRRVEATSSLP
jgi:hypothetical protein